MHKQRCPYEETGHIDHMDDEGFTSIRKIGQTDKWDDIEIVGEIIIIKKEGYIPYYKQYRTNDHVYLFFILFSVNKIEGQEACSPHKNCPVERPE